MNTSISTLNVHTGAALLALHYRAIESQLSFGLFTDLQAVQWAKEIGFEFAPVVSPESLTVQLATACRTKLFNDEIEGFEGRVINLGCGFDTRGQNHDKELWLDIDLEEVIGLRLDNSDDWKSHHVFGDITDEAFMTSMVSEMPTLVLLEGVLDYFPESEVYKILKKVRAFSPEVKVVFDACGTVYKDVPHPVQSGTSESHTIRWGLDVPEQLEHLGFEVTKKTYVHEVALERWKPTEEAFKQYPIMKDHASRVIVMEGVE